MARPQVKLENTLSHFEITTRSGNHCQARCKAHDDKKASLSITIADGRILVFCHAGCAIQDVLKAHTLTFSDLFLTERPIEAAFQYRNADGSFSHEKTKTRNADGSKTFSQWHIEAGKLTNNIEGVKRIPYNYPELITAIKASKPVLCVEGEKDANTGKVLGFDTTTMGGAGDWKDEYKVFFRNANIILVPDKDDAGLKLTSKMVGSLKPVVKSLKVIILPEGKDLTEWVEVGNSDLQSLINKAKKIETANKRGFDWHDYAVTHADLLAKPLLPLSFLVEDMLIDTGTGILAGRKKLGKSFLATQLSQSVAGGAPFLGHRVKQGNVVHFALEDGERRTQSRLRMQEARLDLPITYFYSWAAWNTDEGFNELRAMLSELRPSLVVVDTFAKILNGKPEQNSAGDMGDFGNRMHDLALEQNTMILFIAHHGKGFQMNTRDPGFDIRGSSAIPSSTDANIGLYRNQDKTYELIGEGRDIPEFDFRVSFDKEITWKWRLEGEEQDLRRQEAEQHILDALATLKKADASSISDETDTTRQATSAHLKRMRNYENPPITLIQEGRKFYYTLSSLADIHPLQPLQPLQMDLSARDDLVQQGIEARHDSRLSARDARDDRDLPDCPVCSKCEWSYSGDGKTLVCPCGHRLA